MEPALRQYDFTSPPINVSWPKKVGVFLGVGCLMFILRWAWNGFFHWPNESLVRALITSVIFAAVFVFMQFSYWLPQRLTIGDDFVEVGTRTGSLRFKKRIGREQIKSISENRRGVYIRDRGKFAARILGLIFIPARTPEYQEIKSILSGWAPVQAQR
ncbi:MAG TPA: hypothetical protein VGQ12_05005 [Candidatus Angelobacter sp.]|jgi:hypothetical protein|nr:hypothetical protein [Candidatus Angelobacter sp.]